MIGATTAIMKVSKRRTRLPKLANKIQDHAKRATVRAVNKRGIRRAGFDVLKSNKKLLSTKKAQFKLRFTKNRHAQVGINARRESKSFNKRNILARPVKKAGSKRNRIVRIMGHGQFTITNKVLKELSKVDSAMVQIVSYDRPNDNEFRKCLVQLTDIVRKFGRPHDSKEIVRSDIILPSVDLYIDEAKKLFKGEGVIPAV
jgi:hypothetical protein